MASFSDDFLTEEERAIMADEGTDGSEALDEQPETADDGTADDDEPDDEDGKEKDKDEPEGGEEPAGEQEFEIDGIKFKAVVAADGSHQIPMSVLQQLRDQNKALKAQTAAAPAPESAKPDAEPAPKADDPFAHLRAMSAVERMEYGMESDEHAEELEEFNLVRLEERQVERAAKNRMAEARAVIAEFEAEHSEELADPRYYGAIERSFDKHFASGKSAKEAMALAKADVDEWRSGKSEKEPDPPKKPESKPARRIHSLAGRGSANRGAGGEASPDLDGDNYEAAVAAYEKLSESDKAKWRQGLL